MKLCTFPGCEKRHDCHGLCVSHRAQQKKGKPLTPIAPNLVGQPIEVRFWAKVNKDGPIVREELGPCWVWTAALTEAGYGWFTAERSKGPELAHRLSWSFEHGDADALHVCHHCDNPPCIRPSHLFLGTNRDNHIDAAIKGRLAKVLDANSVREIRSELASGERLFAIAKRRGVKSCTIAEIRDRRIWSHLD